MGKTMTVKKLMRMYSPTKLLRKISDNYGTLYFDDTCAIYDTYDELLNEDDLPVHMDRSYKYHLELMLFVNPESKEIMMDMAKNKEAEVGQRMIRYLYYVLVSNGKHYKISRRYVKSIRDFSLCRVQIPDTLTKMDCACLLLLSFAVLSDKVIGCYGEISSPEYIIGLKGNEEAG